MPDTRKTAIGPLVKLAQALGIEWHAGPGRAERGGGGDRSQGDDSGSAAVLDPIDRSTEVLFGLIMALTFTTTFEVATAGRADVRTMLIGALGCNLAWGIVDGVMFVVTRAVEKSRFHKTVRAVMSASPGEAPRILAQALPEEWGGLLDAPGLARLAERVRALPPPAVPRLAGDDLRGGLAVCVLVCLSTLPVALPFLLFRDLFLAARVSDASGLVMLFLIGRKLGRHAGRPPLLVAFVMVALGVVLSAIAIRLGG